MRAARNLFSDRVFLKSVQNPPFALASGYVLSYAHSPLFPNAEQKAGTCEAVLTLHLYAVSTKRTEPTATRLFGMSGEPAHK